jgi:hypothetical protein
LESERASVSAGSEIRTRSGRASASRTAIAVVAALVLPGLGHAVLGRWRRAAAVAVGVALMFVLGFWMKGHLFTPERGEWLTWFFSFLDLGIGLPYFVCLAADVGFKFPPMQPAVATFEYGNTFLLVAGALNMLAALDTFDIAVGRKG